MQIDELKDAYRALEKSLSSDDRSFKTKVMLLERNLDQISNMYQNVFHERSILKVDLQVSERKLQRKEEKIQKMETSMQQQRTKN